MSKLTARALSEEHVFLLLMWHQIMAPKLSGFVVKILPSPVFSVGNFIQVRFLSSNNVFSGFKAFYQAIFSGGCK